MYTVNKIHYGIKITFSGILKTDEILKWQKDFKKEVDNLTSGFCVYVDMRDIEPISRMVRNIIDEVQRFAKEQGMIRSVVIVKNSIVKRQFQDLAKQTGIYEWERYIDSSSHPNWEQMGIDWLEQALDPDKIEKKILL